MIDELLERVRAWASARPDIRAVALVGSHARGRARADSDVDLVLVTTAPERYLQSTSWTAAFGDVRHTDLEDWGKVQSVRVQYAGGLEIEFGITAPAWAKPPIDTGTRGVIRDGLIVVLDSDSLLARMVAAELSIA